MANGYYNYHPNLVDGWWARRDFARNWWRIYATDPRWVPPHYPTLHRLLEAGRNPHLARLNPYMLYIDALPGSRARTARSGTYGAPVPILFEEPVAAVVALTDRRRQDGSAYLGLLQCANDVGSLERTLEYLVEAFAPLGIRQLIGPTGLSPHVQSGVLQDHFHLYPPLHTPYNPPYLPELMGALLRPLGRSTLYHLEVPLEPPPRPGTSTSTPVQIVSLSPPRLAADLLPLLQAACPAWAGFMLPDAPEAAFILEWLGQWPLQGWLARYEENDVGFVLLQPDLAPQVHRARGGRGLLWRLWLAWRRARPVRAGRLLLGGVLPEWRGRGVGRRLWQHTLQTARQRGWRRLTIGPLPSTAGAGIRFLEAQGAEARQTYLLHRFEF